MKKLFVTMMVVVVSLSVMATETATVRIKLVGSDPSLATSLLRLTEDDARTAAYESGYDSESMMTQSNPYSVLIYSYVETHPCEVVATNNLDNMSIGFTTNMVDEDYTLQFSNFDGDELKLYDLVTYDVVVINGSTPDYEFSVTPSQVGQKQVLDRFVINLPVDEGNLETCFTGTELNITNNPYWYSNIVVKKTSDGSTIKSYDYGTSSIDFNEKDGSGNNIYANNTEYTVYFDKGNHAFIVKVKR